MGSPWMLFPAPTTEEEEVPQPRTPTRAELRERMLAAALARTASSPPDANDANDNV